MTAPTPIPGWVCLVPSNPCTGPDDCHQFHGCGPAPAPGEADGGSRPAFCRRCDGYGVVLPTGSRLAAVCPECNGVTSDRPERGPAAPGEAETVGPELPAADCGSVIAHGPHLGCGGLEYPKPEEEPLTCDAALPAPPDPGRCTLPNGHNGESHCDPAMPLDSPFHAPRPVPGEVTGRPGGWVPGVGWVVRMNMLSTGDRYRYDADGEPGDRPIWAYEALPDEAECDDLCVVVGWADGATPAPPAAPPVQDGRAGVALAKLRRASDRMTAATAAFDRLADPIDRDAQAEWLTAIGSLRLRVQVLLESLPPSTPRSPEGPAT